MVIDNFDNNNDDLLAKIGNFRCHTLITSRILLTSYTYYELTNSTDDAMKILQSYYPDIADQYYPETEGIIETVCNHTMSIQLIVRLLSLSVYTPDELLNKLKITFYWMIAVHTEIISCQMTVKIYIADNYPA